MSSAIQAFHLLVIAVAGWLNRQSQEVIDYLIEENRVLKEQVEGQRLRFTDEQRIRLAVKAKGLGRRLLDERKTLVTPDTLLDPATAVLKTAATVVALTAEKGAAHARYTVMARGGVEG